MRLRTTPFERERRFIASLNMAFVQKALWPLLAVYVLLNFSDALTTTLAAAISPGFVEFNPLGADLFHHGFAGFMIAYGLKFIPVVPLFYMAAFRAKPASDDFQPRLLKFTAFVVLAALDIGLGAIVLGNNVPQLLPIAFKG